MKVIRGGKGDDTLTGTNGPEKIFGGDGNDVINSLGGMDKIAGGNGDDTITAYNLEQAYVDGSWPNPIINGNDGNDRIISSNPYKGQVHVWGGEGNDYIEVDLTKDSEERFGQHLYGGNGADTFNFSNVDKSLTSSIGRIDDFDFSRDTIQIEGKTLDLNKLPDEARVVEYQSQQWLLIENKVMYSLEGVRNSDDPEDGQNNHFPELPEDMSKLETVEYIDQLNYVPYQLYSDRVDEMNDVTGKESVLNGTNDDDYMYPSVEYPDSKAQTYYGRGGDDIINANRGNDSVYGGWGNDSIAGGADDDRLVGSFGDDLIYGGSQNDKLYGGFGEDSLYGGTGNDYMRAGWENDYLNGGHGNDDLNGGSGDDTMLGGSGEDKLGGSRGDDLIFGEGQNDKIYGGSGEDILYGGTGDDYMRGGNQNDLLYGGEGEDRLNGDRGDDIISGGTGKDIVDGGQGSDQYIFRSGDLQEFSMENQTEEQAYNQIDLIKEFELDKDKIVFDEFKNVGELDDLSADTITLDDNLYIFVKVNETDERMLIDVEDDTKLEDFWNEENISIL